MDWRGNKCEGRFLSLSLGTDVLCLLLVKFVVKLSIALRSTNFNIHSAITFLIVSRGVLCPIVGLLDFCFYKK